MRLEIGFGIAQDRGGLLALKQEELLLTWPVSTPEELNSDFCTALEAAVKPGLQLSLKSERFSGFSTAVLLDAELILLCMDLLFNWDHVITQLFFPTILIFEI